MREEPPSTEAQSEIKLGLVKKIKNYSKIPNSSPLNTYCQNNFIKTILRKQTKEVL